MRRWVAALAVMAASTTGITPTAAADPGIQADRIVCGPVLRADDGRMKLCGQSSGDRGRNGHYLLATKTYRWGEWKALVSECLVSRWTSAPDGHAGWVVGYPQVNKLDGLTGVSGVYTYGTQSKKFGDQVHGRWGYVDHRDRLFHPTTEWHMEENGLEPDPGTC